ncbi:MAG: DnaA ATPase domain-containing protein, partial [Rubrivivax sp.]
MIADLWQRGCERLATELPEHQFNTWIRPLPPAQLSGGTGAEGEEAVASVRVPNRFKLDWIRNQYAGRIESVLSDIAGRPVRLELLLAARAPAPTGAAAPARAANGAVHASQGLLLATQGVHEAAQQAALADQQRDLARSQPAAPAPQPLSTTPAANRNKLNPSLTFDTLVAGRANQMARTAALHVAGAPGAMYNPLFIYGGVGLGKTHLVHAVGNALLKDRPDARVLYL